MQSLPRLLRSSTHGFRNTKFLTTPAEVGKRSRGNLVTAPSSDSTRAFRAYRR
jgi:hypothetical protein